MRPIGIACVSTWRLQMVVLLQFPLFYFGCFWRLTFEFLEIIREPIYKTATRGHRKGYSRFGFLDFGFIGVSATRTWFYVGPVFLGFPFLFCFFLLFLTFLVFRDPFTFLVHDPVSVYRERAQISHCKPRVFDVVAVSGRGNNARQHPIIL